jgi:hypothetical protein
MQFGLVESLANHAQYAVTQNPKSITQITTIR